MMASQKGLMSTLEHAAYLGSEVEKAFTALKLERSYIQDTPLF
jgi:dihydropteroate synthase